MGTFYYGGTAIHIADRALAHLQVVVAAKLRRQESFTVSWRHPEDDPHGRSTIWLHPSIPIRFLFNEPPASDLSREWIEELATSASSTGGLLLSSERFDYGPIHCGDSTADASFGDVELQSLNVGRLRIAGRNDESGPVS